MNVSYCSIVNVACERKALLTAGTGFVSYAFHNVFPEILWHFSLKL